MSSGPIVQSTNVSGDMIVMFTSRTGFDRDTFGILVEFWVINEQDIRVNKCGRKRSLNTECQLLFDLWNLDEISQLVS